MPVTRNLVNIASDFAPFPAGRIESDGPFNGEKFRETILIPKLNSSKDQGTVLMISLDGLKSCGSSFLDSAFGGLVRYSGFTKSELSKLMAIEFSRPSLERYKIAIERYIDRAKPEKQIT